MSTHRPAGQPHSIQTSKRHLAPCARLLGCEGLANQGCQQPRPGYPPSPPPNLDISHFIFPLGGGRCWSGGGGQPLCLPQPHTWPCTVAVPRTEAARLRAARPRQVDCRHHCLAPPGAEAPPQDLEPAEGCCHGAGTASTRLAPGSVRKLLTH